MELWMILVLYAGGLAFIVIETLVPGLVMGLLGTAAIVVSVLYGLQYHWALGAGQIVLTLIVAPVAIFIGIRGMGLKSTLAGDVSFAQDYTTWLGKEGEAYTELRPAGIALLDGKRIDVVAAIGLIEKGQRIRVVKVEGNRIVVQAI